METVSVNLFTPLSTAILLTVNEAKLTKITAISRFVKRGTGFHENLTKGFSR